MKKRKNTRDWDPTPQIDIMWRLYRNHKNASKIFFSRWLDELEKLDPKVHKSVAHEVKWGMSPETSKYIADRKLQEKANADS